MCSEVHRVSLTSEAELVDSDQNSKSRRRTGRESPSRWTGPSFVSQAKLDAGQWVLTGLGGRCLGGESSHVVPTRGCNGVGIIPVERARTKMALDRKGGTRNAGWGPEEADGILIDTDIGKIRPGSPSHGRRNQTDLSKFFGVFALSPVIAPQLAICLPYLFAV